MHLKRNETVRNLPIARKGTKYIVRALSHHRDGVAVVMAVRDILGLAKTSKEVKKMVHEKMLKINGKLVKDIRQAVKVFDVLEAGKSYRLTLTPQRKFSFEEVDGKTRIAKVVDKRMVKGGKKQIVLHDGTNILSDEKIDIGGSVELEIPSKFKKFISLEKGRDAFVRKGRMIGSTGKIENVDGKKVTLKIGERRTELDQSQVIVL